MALLVLVQLCVVTVISINSMAAELPLSIDRRARETDYPTAEKGEEFLPMMFARQWGGGSYTKREQKAILEAHNNYRKAVEPSASNMNELVWSPALAEEAQRWSDGCFNEHPEKTVYTQYKTIGQNLFITWNDHGYDTPKPMVTYPTDEWYNEVRDYHYDTNTCNPGKACGHYTQVVWAKTKEVGCGITFCPMATDNKRKKYRNAWLVTCNYSPIGNFKGQSPYEEGQRCSKCEDGFCKNNLCSKCKPQQQGCGCYRKCENCGKLNTKKCSCKCPEGFLGDSCEQVCEDLSESCGQNPGLPEYFCGRISYVNLKCPALCGDCTPPLQSPQCPSNN